ncbi:MAG: SGNH/GDSL hydrolase family protein, partial [Gammaproteobacteria bacterium]|nr:SGNH/GDSL hydrolase family protein [Gammaproteobacteria bacterium]
MKAEDDIHSSAWRIALIAATLMVSGCDSVNEAINRGGPDTYYYVSLGTSLSVGVQPNGSGIPLPTDDGYADQLFDRIRPAFEAGSDRELNLIRLGCPGETLDDFVNGISCPYLAGSQLAAAIDFLNDNSGKVHLVTIDMGGNDFRNADCMDATDPVDCATTVSTQIAMDLAIVLAALRDAAGPDTTIVGMNYYNPYLSSWLEDAAGQTLATQSALAVSVLTGFLDTTYATAGVPVADVAAAFESDDFTLVDSPLPAPNDVGQLPVNVVNICQFTYQCDPDPVGPDIHANTAGYSLIANTI